MALVKLKPTSPGRRGVVRVVTPGLHKGAPIAALVESQTRGSGRNNNGHITTRHQGGGHKKHYRIIDFRRDKDGIIGKVERIEHDPNRSAHIALLCYRDGERRYIIAPRGIGVGAELLSGPEAPIKPGNALPLRNIPVGTTVRVINCVHDHTAHRWAYTAPTHRTGFTDRFKVVLFVAHITYRSSAVDMNFADLAGT